MCEDGDFIGSLKAKFGTGGEVSPSACHSRWLCGGEAPSSSDEGEGAEGAHWADWAEGLGGSGEEDARRLACVAMM